MFRATGSSDSSTTSLLATQALLQDICAKTTRQEDLRRRGSEASQGSNFCLAEDPSVSHAPTLLAASDELQSVLGSSRGDTWAGAGDMFGTRKRTARRVSHDAHATYPADYAPRRCLPERRQLLRLAA